jgi:hypothetical protein
MIFEIIPVFLREHAVISPILFPTLGKVRSLRQFRLLSIRHDLRQRLATPRHAHLFPRGQPRRDFREMIAEVGHGRGFHMRDISLICSELSMAPNRAKRSANCSSARLPLSRRQRGSRCPHRDFLLKKSRRGRRDPPIPPCPLRLTPVRQPEDRHALSSAPCSVAVPGDGRSP